MKLVAFFQISRILRFVLVLLALVATASAVEAQTRPTTTATNALLPGETVIQHLDQTIDWYRRVVALEQSSTDSQELLLRSALHQNARQAVQLALRFARAESAIMETASKNDSSRNSGSRGRNAAQAAADASQRAEDFRVQIETLDRQITNAPAASLDVLYARRYELLAQLNLANTQRDVLQQHAAFMVTADNGDGVALAQKIDELERSLPELRTDAAKPTASNAPSATPPAQAFHPEDVGIFGLVGELMRLSNRMGDVKRLADDAQHVREDIDKLRGPMRDDVINTMRASQATTAAIANAASTSPSTQPDDPIAMEKRGMQIDELTDRFKQLSSLSFPLSEQGVVMEAARDSLLDWRQTLSRQYNAAIRSLLLRLGTLLGTILVIFVISEVWRRAIFRYITDARRQRQLMLVRRLVVGLVVLIIIAVSVVTEFGSIATFAGLITAGVAVALQTVILSGVAYFFMIGRFGVRVGDRVTIAGITGDVIEIGLFRIYLMELSGSKPELHSTGRVVVFSNSVLFQPSAFYKQLPGSDYIWHEVGMTLAPTGDYKHAETRLMDAVHRVFNDYRPMIERQHAQISKSLHVNVGTAAPEGRLRFTNDGLEFVIRYPVDIHQATQIDDRITRELINEINTDPKLQLVKGMPMIRTS